MTQILQGKNNDIIKGLDLINTLLNIFELVRNDIDNRHNKWYQEALALATAAHLSESKPRTCFKMSAKENHPSDTTSEFYKRSFTIAVVDEVYGQLKRRFTGDNSIVFEVLYIIPNIMIYSVNQGDGVCWRSKFKNFLKFYERDFGQISMKTLKSELDLWEEHWCQSKTCLPDSVSTTLKSINFPCFPIIKTALRILGTLPVTSCSCERSFSALRKLKMYNRSTMSNERLSALALLYMHVEIDPDPQFILGKSIALGPR